MKQDFGGIRSYGYGSIHLVNLSIARTVGSCKTLVEKGPDLDNFWRRFRALGRVRMYRADHASMCRPYEWSSVWILLGESEQNDNFVL